MKLSYRDAVKAFDGGEISAQNLWKLKEVHDGHLAIGAEHFNFNSVMFLYNNQTTNKNKVLHAY